ncbi:RsmB/NOP family class I SAM-dependent RNA methyltransferase [Rhodoblastus acidophilus]|uniref:RsmB/NOP family class I SAM-dependent RNA methyltransferase n=1 Tax=Candidatus Rhodoblastus alkanivorans TaxID=2954117 RepID=A0ABS9Z2J6_9HYPH|nr:RsmB/NOP family class I SAM-dependent RNA methyltransferase [Candidatus Rhodoblastus alkanivorans]MCI4678129.1 RsmB/NOP family class I SAM-dependent RNA methyltransferase [Candidatus Rhodoblastus alkanivorans]MCI4681530.1 RsmB/NOP family class I SAM-dependent RNA methyltransferase [Candidatus Rhodoblastus alkanivorans]MDI4642578.1 RsmB/NOP family class I SAM-dependent RNA methyltransferase [Rhodoblastus acidophilus]
MNNNFDRAFGRSGKQKSSAKRHPDQTQAEALAHPGLAARVAAAAIISDIIHGGHTLDEKFSPDAAPSRLGGLSSRDRDLARSIVTVALRRLGTIRLALSQLVEKGLPRNCGTLEWILIAGGAQLLFLDTPDHAAVDLAVRAARLDSKSAPFANLVNGVLRNLIRRRDEFLSQSDPLDDDTPHWMAARWRRIYGEDRAHSIAAAFRDEPTLDLTVKADAASWAERLGGRLLPTGSIRLETHAPIPELPGYGEGAWWVQDAAAALPARILAVKPGQRVLDLCAAPGGKTAQLAAAGARVTALDRSAERLKTLSANLARLQLEASIAVGDAASYKAEPFDAILLDAPCSATGTIRRSPDVLWTKKPGDIAALTAIQTKILDRAFTLLKPGAALVYCVCSLEPEEGEAQIAALLRRNPDAARDPIDPSCFGLPPEAANADGELRLLPYFFFHDQSRQRGLDGFFIARLKRLD